MSNNRIAELAIATRTHIVEALTGLDEIIRLAQAAGRDDIAATAKRTKQPIVEAAKTFNGQVSENSGDATKIDPATVKAADKAATEGKKTCEELLKELEKKVDANKKEADSAFALLGLDFQAGKAQVTKDGWVDKVSNGLSAHQATLYGENGKSGLVQDVKDIQKHLGHTRGEDGSVTFDALNGRIVWWPTIIALIAAFLVFTIILAFGSGMIWALGSTGGVLILAAIVHILFNRNK